MVTLSLILAVIALGMVVRMQKQVEALQSRLNHLERQQSPIKGVAPKPVEAPVVPTSTAWRAAVADAPPPAETPPEQPAPHPGEQPQRPDETTEPPTARPQKAAAFSIERLVGVHLPVWGGAAMLLIGGFLLARMAASSGFFTPGLGIAACAAAGFAMLAAAFVLRRLRIANHEQISAALASAAIGTLYAASFLASALFELTSVETGFVLAALTGFVSIAISMVFGRPVLIIGLIGAYLAPALLVTAYAGGFLIQLYLAALLVAATIACARKSWWGLLALVLLPHSLWLLGLSTVTEADWGQSLAIALLLVFTPAVVGIAAWQRGAPKPAGFPLFLALALSLFLATTGVTETAYPPLFLSTTMGLFLLGAIISFITPVRPTLPVLMITLAWVYLVLIWRFPEPPHRLIMALLAMAAIGTPLVRLLREGRDSVEAATLLCAALSFTAVSTMFDLNGWAGLRDLPLLWALLSLALSASVAYAGLFFWPKTPEKGRPRLGSIFAVTASGFISMAVVAIVDPDYFALAAALQVLGIALVQQRFAAVNLRPLIAAYLALYAGLLFIAAGLSEIGAPLTFARYLPHTAPWDAAIAALLLPAMAFLAAATVLTPKGTDALAKILDGAAVLLLAAAANFLIIPNDTVLDPRDTLYWASIWLNPILLIGLLGVFAGTRLVRDGLRYAGMALSLFVLAVAVAFVGLPPYQLWPEWNVPGLPLFNLSILGLILPGLLALALAHLLRAIPPLRWTAVAVGGFLIITGLLVDIRHLFHPDLLQGASGPIERYSYSGALLVLAFGALGAGTRFNSQPLRLASLGIMLLTVVKVFLFDFGGLEGLWRVASFAALGVALLVTSWIYARFVFPRTEAASSA
ncbi:DUF2339 domain-containing protein [Devosia riboflavina]